MEDYGSLNTTRCLGLFHGCLAQAFFCLVATIALVTSRFWRRLEPVTRPGNIRALRFGTIAVTVMLFDPIGLGGLDAALAHRIIDS